MTAPRWTWPLPGGVTDPEQRLALWRGPDGALRALRLADGALLWQTPPALAPLRPLLPGDDTALALAFRPARVVGLRVQPPGAGEVQWQGEPLPWPAWAADLDDPGDALHLQAACVDGGAVLSWRLVPRHEGGAPPGPDVALPSPSEGSWRIDPRTGHGEPVAFVPPPADAGTPADADPALAHLPGVLQARCVTPDRGYGLLLSSDGRLQQTSLAAVDRHDGRLLWCAVVDERPLRRPPRLRP